SRASRAPRGSCGAAGPVLRGIWTSSTSVITKDTKDTKDTKEFFSPKRNQGLCPLCPLCPSCPLCPLCSPTSQSPACLNLFTNRVEHPVDELDRLLRRERPRQLERFIDHDGGRSTVRRVFVEQLADRHAQDQTIEHRHPFGPPALGRVGDQRVDV